MALRARLFSLLYKKAVRRRHENVAPATEDHFVLDDPRNWDNAFASALQEEYSPTSIDLDTAVARVIAALVERSMTAWLIPEANFISEFKREIAASPPPSPFTWLVQEVLRSTQFEHHRVTEVRLDGYRALVAHGTIRLICRM